MKRGLILFIIIITLFSIVFASEDIFSDLPRDHWAYTEVEEFKKLGFVLGKTDGSLGTNDLITAEEFFVILSNVLTKLNEDKIEGEVYLEKQFPNTWSKDEYINLAKFLGAKSGEKTKLGRIEITLIFGNDDEEVLSKLSKPITREQVANMLGLFVSDGVNISVNIIDAIDWNDNEEQGIIGVNSGYKSRINELIEKDIFRGKKQDGVIYISPKTTITKVETIALLYRLYTYKTQANPENKNDNNPIIGEGKNYFDDALFIGDSRVVGRQLCGNLDNATYFAVNGASVYNISNEYVKVNGIGNVNLNQLLLRKKFGKVYILLGINGIGYDLDKSVKKYKELIDSILAKQPNAIICIEANLHVSKVKANSNKIFSNSRINSLNSKLASLVNNKNIFYLDANKIFDDGKGNLASKYTSDGLHLYPKYYKEWTNWIEKNGMKK